MPREGVANPRTPASGVASTSDGRREGRIVASYDPPAYQDRTPAGPVYQSTGAPGSTGLAPGSAGPVVGDPRIVNDGESTQLPAERVTVTSGHTFSGSDGQPVHDTGPMLAGGDRGSAPGATGSGQGRAGHHRHPDSAGAGQ